MPVLPRHYLPFISSNLSLVLPTEHTNSFIYWSQNEETVDEINHVGKSFQASVDGFLYSQSKYRIKWSNGQRYSERWWEWFAWYGCIYWWKSRDFGLVNVHSAYSQLSSSVCWSTDFLEHLPVYIHAHTVKTHKSICFMIRNRENSLPAWDS